jgi:hypothetical protein
MLSGEAPSIKTATRLSGAVNVVIPWRKNSLVASISSSVRKTRFGIDDVPEVQRVTTRRISDCETVRKRCPY